MAAWRQAMQPAPCTKRHAMCRVHVLSRLHDARHYILRHAVNAMHYVSQPCTMRTPCIQPLRFTVRTVYAQYVFTYFLSTVYTYCTLNLALLLFYIIGIVSLHMYVEGNKTLPWYKINGIQTLPVKVFLLSPLKSITEHKCTFVQSRRVQKLCRICFYCGRHYILRPPWAKSQLWQPWQRAYFWFY